jgi:hypothetical protein
MTSTGQNGVHRDSPVEIGEPRDTSSTFDPQIVTKRQRRLTGIDEPQRPTAERHSHRLRCHRTGNAGSKQSEVSVRTIGA